MLDLVRQRGDARQTLENQILLDNINIQDQRRNAFTDLVTGLDQAEFDRANIARQNFTNALAGARNDELQRELFNIGQQANLLSGQQALFFGAQGDLEARRNAIRNARLGRKQFELAEEAANSQSAAAANAAAQTQALIGQIIGSLGGGGTTGGGATAF